METTDNLTMKIVMNEMRDLERRYAEARAECRHIKKLWQGARLLALKLGDPDADVPEYIWEKS